MSLLLYDPLNCIHAFLQRLHARSVTNPDKMVAWTVEQVSALTRIEIEKDTLQNKVNKHRKMLDLMRQ